MALAPAFLEELRARTPLPALIGRRVRLARSGRQWKGCCPFHGEKTPSFYVYDDHYHCFGCGAHGDAIAYVMQAEGMGFMEAVQSLAAEAGLEVPKPSPEAQAAERARLDLAAILERAAAVFQRRLALPEGAAARAYLASRGVHQASLERFGLGFAPPRGALVTELTREGVTSEAMQAAGLLRAREEGGEAREFFAGRLMFPIRDRRGQVISFGGRVLGEGQPKYLNGPETALFAKRRTLYNIDLARAALREGAQAIVVEGYLDVISLDQAGLAGAVAPLGTALSEEQLETLWQLAPEPVLCFDGDAAGRRAALRAIRTALPLIAPDRSLRIAPLPAGEDPDSLVRASGAAGFESAVLARAVPLDAALYALLQSEFPAVTPEGRSAFLKALMLAAGSIPDPTLAGEYRRALKDRFYGGRDKTRARARAAPAAAPIRARPLRGEAERVRILLATLLGHPRLAPEVEEDLATLDLPPDLAALAGAAIAWSLAAAENQRENPPRALDSEALITHLRATGYEAAVERVLARKPGPLPRFVSPETPPEEVAAGWLYFFGLLSRRRLDEEVAAVQRETSVALNAPNERRLVALTNALLNLAAGEPEATADDAGDTGSRDHPT
jgi:DNA primase